MPKKTKVRPKKRSTMLPTNIVKIVENMKLKGAIKQHAYKILDLIFVDYLQEELLFESYRDYPSKYWKKAVAEHYERAIQELEKNEVIHINHSYSTINEQSKKYRINPDLIEDDLKKVVYIDFAPEEKQNSYICKMTRGVLRMLRIDKVAAKRFVKHYVESGEVEAGLRFNNDVLNANNLPILYKPEGSRVFKKRYMRKEKALELAESLGLDLIEDKRKIIIHDKETYVNRKKHQVRFSYMMQIEKISTRTFYAKRNDTNSRLDSNLTNIASVLIPFLTLDGEQLVGLDLANSQFVFLASLIEEGLFNKYILKATNGKSKVVEKTNAKNRTKIDSIISFNKYKQDKNIIESINKAERVIERFKNNKEWQAYMCANSDSIPGKKKVENPVITRDIGLFIKLAKNGGLYEYIQSALNFEEGEKGRKRAKGVMFLIFFSKHNYSCTAKREVNALFPTLVQMIDLFKKEKREENKKALEDLGLADDKKGDNQFAITLQKKESDVFIDFILRGLYKSSYKVLSKHDSILCKQSDLEAVKTYMMEVLDYEFGAGNFILKEECKDLVKENVHG